MAASSVGEGDCHKDPNFAVVCSFLDKYGTSLGLEPISYSDLQHYLEDTVGEVSRILIDIHIRLLRRIGKSSVNSDRFEKSIIKFCHHFSEFDAWEVESYGYKHAQLSTKVRILKNLLESQFDFNIKFKEKINGQSAEEMRFVPIGRDKDGQAYWYFLDHDMNLLVYKEEQDDEAADTWKLVCRNRHDLANLVSSLRDGKELKIEDKVNTSGDSRSSKEGSPDEDITVDIKDTKLAHDQIVKEDKSSQEQALISIKDHASNSQDETENKIDKNLTEVLKKEKLDKEQTMIKDMSCCKQLFVVLKRGKAGLEENIIKPEVADVKEEKSFQEKEKDVKKEVEAGKEQEDISVKVGKSKFNADDEGKSCINTPKITPKTRKQRHGNKNEKKSDGEWVVKKEKISREHEEISVEQEKDGNEEQDMDIVNEENSVIQVDDVVKKKTENINNTHSDLPTQGPVNVVAMNVKTSNSEVLANKDIETIAAESNKEDTQLSPAAEMKQNEDNINSDKVTVNKKTTNSEVLANKDIGTAADSNKDSAEHFSEFQNKTHSSCNKLMVNDHIVKVTRNVDKAEAQSEDDSLPHQSNLINDISTQQSHSTEEQVMSNKFSHTSGNIKQTDTKCVALTDEIETNGGITIKQEEDNALSDMNLKQADNIQLSLAADMKQNEDNISSESCGAQKREKNLQTNTNKDKSLIKKDQDTFKFKVQQVKEKTASDVEDEHNDVSEVEVNQEDLRVIDLDVHSEETYLSPDTELHHDESKLASQVKQIELKAGTESTANQNNTITVQDDGDRQEQATTISDLEVNKDNEIKIVKDVRVKCAEEKETHKSVTNVTDNTRVIEQVEENQEKLQVRSVDEKEDDSKVDGKPDNSKVDEIEYDPKVDEKQEDLKVDEKQDDSKVEEIQDDPKVEEKQDSKVEEIQDDPKVEEIQEDSKVEEKQDSKVGEIQDDPKVEEKQKDSKVEEKQDSKVEEIQDNSKVDKIQEDSKVEEIQLDSKVDEKQEVSKVDKIQEDSKVEKIQEDSKVDEIKDDSKVDDKKDDSIVDEKQNDSKVDVIQEESKVDKIQEDSIVDEIEEDSKVEEMLENSKVDKIQEYSKVEEIQDSQVTHGNEKIEDSTVTIVKKEQKDLVADVEDLPTGGTKVTTEAPINLEKTNEDILLKDDMSQEKGLEGNTQSPCENEQSQDMPPASAESITNLEHHQNVSSSVNVVNNTGVNAVSQDVPVVCTIESSCQGSPGMDKSKAPSTLGHESTVEKCQINSEQKSNKCLDSTQEQGKDSPSNTTLVDSAECSNLKVEKTETSAVIKAADEKNTNVKDQTSIVNKNVGNPLPSSEPDNKVVCAEELKQESTKDKQINLESKTKKKPRQKSCVKKAAIENKSDNDSSLKTKESKEAFNLQKTSNEDIENSDKSHTPLVNGALDSKTDHHVPDKIVNELPVDNKTENIVASNNDADAAVEVNGSTNDKSVVGEEAGSTKRCTRNGALKPPAQPRQQRKRAVPEPGSDDPLDSEPNGKRARQATKTQKTRAGRNAAARGRAAMNKDTESDDSETPLSQVRSKARGLPSEPTGRITRRRANQINQTNKVNQEPVVEDDGEEGVNGKRGKKKKPDSSSEVLSEEEVTPAKKGRNQTQAKSVNKAKACNKGMGASKAKKPTVPAPVVEVTADGIRRSSRVKQLRARRPPSSPSEESDETTEEDEEFTDEYEDDHEKNFLDASFTPEEEESGDEEFKPKGRNFQRQAARTQQDDTEEVINDDTPCVKCAKYNHPEMILLCDKCDAGYHTACLRPPLMLIPDGDWFCPPCEHSRLVEKLLECLQSFDVSMKKKDRLSKRQERLAFVGISISNILHGGRNVTATSKFEGRHMSNRQNSIGKEMKEGVDYSVNQEEEYENSSANDSEHEPKRSFRSERLALRQAQKRSRRDRNRSNRRQKYSPEIEVLSQRACRTRAAVSYQFKEFDELISSAIEDDKPFRKEKPPGISRGKDMSNILGASDEEDEKIRQRDGDTGLPPPVVRKKTKRRLTRLESDDEADDDDESEEFQISEDEDSEASDGEGEDAEVCTSDSGDWRPQKTWYNSHTSSRRSSRKMKNFVVDGDDDDDYNSDENATKRRSTRNSNRARIHYSDWDSDEDETEAENSVSEFSSDNSFSCSMKSQRKKTVQVKKRGRKKQAKHLDKSDSDSSLTIRRKNLRKLIKKRRKDTSESDDSPNETEKVKQQVSKKRANKLESEDSEYALDEDSQDGSEESPKFKKKNVLRSSDEEDEAKEEDEADLTSEEDDTESSKDVSGSGIQDEAVKKVEDVSQVKTGSEPLVEAQNVCDDKDMPIIAGKGKKKNDRQDQVTLVEAPSTCDVQDLPKTASKDKRNIRPDQVTVVEAQNTSDDKGLPITAGKGKKRNDRHNKVAVVEAQNPSDDKDLLIKVGKGKKRNDRHDQITVAVTDSAVPDKVRKVSISDKEQDIIREVRSHQPVSDVNVAVEDKNKHEPTKNKSLIPDERPVTMKPCEPSPSSVSTGGKKKTLPNFLDVNSGEESDEQKPEVVKEEPLFIADMTNVQTTGPPSDSGQPRINHVENQPHSQHARFPNAGQHYPFNIRPYNNSVQGPTPYPHQFMHSAQNLGQVRHEARPPHCQNLSNPTPHSGPAGLIQGFPDHMAQHSNIRPGNTAAPSVRGLSSFINRGPRPSSGHPYPRYSNPQSMEHGQNTTNTSQEHHMPHPNFQGIPVSHHASQSHPPPGPAGSHPSQGQPGSHPPHGPPGSHPAQGPPGSHPSQGPAGNHPSLGPPGSHPHPGPPGSHPHPGPPGSHPHPGPPGSHPHPGPPGSHPSQAPPGNHPSPGPPGSHAMSGMAQQHCGGMRPFYMGQQQHPHPNMEAEHGPRMGGYIAHNYRPRQMPPGQERGAGAIRNPYYNMQASPPHSMGQQLAGQYPGNMSSPLTSMGQMTRNLAPGTNMNSPSNTQIMGGCEERRSSLGSPPIQDSTQRQEKLTEMRDVKVKTECDADDFPGKRVEKVGKKRAATSKLKKKNSELNAQSPNLGQQLKPGLHAVAEVEERLPEPGQMPGGYRGTGQPYNMPHYQRPYPHGPMSNINPPPATQGAYMNQNPPNSTIQGSNMEGSNFHSKDNEGKWNRSGSGDGQNSGVPLVEQKVNLPHYQQNVNKSQSPGQTVQPPERRLSQSPVHHGSEVNQSQELSSAKAPNTRTQDPIMEPSSHTQSLTPTTHAPDTSQDSNVRPAVSGQPMISNSQDNTGRPVVSGQPMIPNSQDSNVRPAVSGQPMLPNSQDHNIRASSQMQHRPMYFHGPGPESSGQYYSGGPYPSPYGPNPNHHNVWRPETHGYCPRYGAPHPYPYNMNTTNSVNRIPSGKPVYGHPCPDTVDVHAKGPAASQITSIKEEPGKKVTSDEQHVTRHLATSEHQTTKVPDPGSMYSKNMEQDIKPMMSYPQNMEADVKPFHRRHSDGALEGDTSGAQRPSQTMSDPTAVSLPTTVIHTTSHLIDSTVSTSVSKQVSNQSSIQHSTSSSVSQSPGTSVAPHSTCSAMSQSPGTTATPQSTSSTINQTPGTSVEPHNTCSTMNQTPGTSIAPHNTSSTMNPSSIPSHNTCSTMNQSPVTSVPPYMNWPRANTNIPYTHSQMGQWPNMANQGHYGIAGPYSAATRSPYDPQPNSLRPNPSHTDQKPFMYPPYDIRYQPPHMGSGPGDYHRPGYNQEYPPHGRFSQHYQNCPPRNQDSGSNQTTHPGIDQATDGSTVSKPKRAKTQKKTAKDGSGPVRGKSGRGRGRGRGGFMIDNLLEARVEDEQGEDSGEINDIVSYVTTDEYFKQQTSSGNLSRQAEVDLSRDKK